MKPGVVRPGENSKGLYDDEDVYANKHIRAGDCALSGVPRSPRLTA